MVQKFRGKDKWKRGTIVMEQYTQKGVDGDIKIGSLNQESIVMIIKWIWLYEHIFEDDDYIANIESIYFSYDFSYNYIPI